MKKRMALAVKEAVLSYEEESGPCSRKSCPIPRRKRRVALAAKEAVPSHEEEWQERQKKPSNQMKKRMARAVEEGSVSAAEKEEALRLTFANNT